MSEQGEWIANCLPDRVDRIKSASVFMLSVGPPIPNQMQTQEDLLERGLVGLYRTGKKSEVAVRRDQESYLRQSDFTPSPGALRSIMEPLGGG